MRITLIILVTTLVGCASARNKRLAEYKKITKDICVDNHHEVKLAQILYNKMLK